MMYGNLQDTDLISPNFKPSLAMHRISMSSWNSTYCRSAQAVFKHVMHKVGGTATLNSQQALQTLSSFLHLSSCLCYREIVQNSIWLCCPPRFVCASFLQLQLKCCKSIWRCHHQCVVLVPHTGLSALEGVSLRKQCDNCKESLLI